MDLTIIQNKIYEIRGERVMLDKDLAELYQVETRRLNEAVKRNIKRFPPDFMFELSKEEADSLRSQFATLDDNNPKNINSQRGRHSKYLPYVFTEQGIAMLAGLLNSDIAIEVNISIMRAFVAMRRFLLSATLQNKEVEQVKKEMGELKQYIEEVFTDYNDLNEDTSLQLELINETLARLSSSQEAMDLQLKRKQIGFKKQ